MPKSQTISIRIEASDYLQAQEIANENNTSVCQVIRACATHALRQLSEQANDKTDE